MTMLSPAPSEGATETSNSSGRVWSSRWIPTILGTALAGCGEQVLLLPKTAGQHDCCT